MGSRDGGCGGGGIRTIYGVVEEGADVGDKEGIEEFGDFFLVSEGEGTFVGDPVGNGG